MIMQVYVQKNFFFFVQLHINMCNELIKNMTRKIYKKIFLLYKLRVTLPLDIKIPTYSTETF